MAVLLQDIYKQGVTYLKGHVANPNLEVRVLLSYILSFSTIEIITKDNYKVSWLQCLRVRLALMRRKRGYPLAYIVKQKEFWNSYFYVNKHVLIPRSDSETLISAALQKFTNVGAKLNILDIGVGSGCILLSLLQEYPNSFGVGIDISKKSLAVAKINANKLELSARASFLKSNIFSNLISSKFGGIKYDIIISNPPYIAFGDSNVEKNVAKYEPKQALYASNNGLYFYDEIFKNAKTFLKDNGKILVEIGFSQKDDVITIAKNCGYSLLSCYKDLAKIDRVLVFGQH